MAQRTLAVFLFTRSTGKFVETTVPRRTTTPGGYMVAYGSQMYDALLLVPTCKEHGRVLLEEFKKANCYYLPFYPLRLDFSWKDQMRHGLNLLLTAVGYSLESAAQLFKTRLHQLNQFRHPRYAAYIQQLVVLVKLENCQAQCNNLEDTTPYKWFPICDITPNHAQIWGPEPCLYLLRSSHAPNSSVGSKCRELSIECEFKGSLPSKRWTLAQSIKYTVDDRLGLYNDFLQHCYPSQFMNQLVFEEFLAKTKMKLNVNDNRPCLYAAFCIDSPYIRFRDLLLSLVALDRCPHGDIGGELRARCIFRYYTQIGSPTMNFNELVSLNRDIAASKGASEANGPVSLAESLFAKLDLDKAAGISMEQFIRAVGKLEIRGTSAILRAVQSPREELRNRTAFKMTWAQVVKMERLLEKRTLPPLCELYCLNCGDPEYSMSTHSIAYDIVTGATVAFQEQSTERAAKVPKHIREHSEKAVNPQDKYNYLRDILRRFSAERQGCPLMPLPKDSSTLPNWTRKLDRDALVERIIAVCQESRAAFLSGPRVIRISSPVFVFGDIHGNFHDLMIYEHLFWRLAPCGFVANSLFLGDYVDRGNDSLECIIYLLCMRALLPDKFHLLRGNHEMRQVQKAFTTYRECLEKFGPKGPYVWESLNSVFDCMPFCAVIDEQVFAAHGGIPATSPNLETLCTLNVPLKNPNFDANIKAGWEMLWNDPITQSDYQDCLRAFEAKTLFPKFPAGFVFNSKRGTAFYYSQQAVDRFLALNGLSFLIRAHEMTQSGFLFLMDGRMMTVFSSSHYCGASNQSAVVFIEKGKMRVIKIETSQSFRS